MIIRQMNRDDYEAVRALWSETAGIGLRSLDDSKSGIGRFLKRNPFTSFVAEEEGAVAGAILCGHDGRRGYIYHTAVREDCRRQGIGKAMVVAALHALRKEGILKVALVAYQANDLGNTFWKALGFVERKDLVYRNFSLNDDNL